MSSNELEYCICGRLSSNIHCPQCGRSNIYALKQRAKIPTGATTFEEVNVYRCRTCNNNFTDKERKLCAAPEVQKTKKEIDKEVLAEQLRDKAMRGDTFDHIDKMKFRKACGMRYEEFMIMLSTAAKATGVSTGELIRRTQEKKATEDKKKHEYIPKPAPPTSVDGFKDVEVKEESMDDLEDYLKDA